MNAEQQFDKLVSLLEAHITADRQEFAEARVVRELIRQDINSLRKDLKAYKTRWTSFGLLIGGVVGGLLSVLSWLRG